MTLLCTSPRCHLPGRHRDECGDETCRGCLPARAADGLMLCTRCTERIGKDAVEVARLWYEIGLILAASGSTGIPAHNPHPGLVLNGQAADMRLEIRHVLASWVRLIAEERGMQLPVDESQHSLGAYIRLHEQWLAASAYADEVADEFASLRGRAWATAYPEGVSVRLIGPCPELEDGAPCPGNVKAHMRRFDSLLPSKVVCDVNSHHEWTAERWHVLGRSVGLVLSGYLSVETIAVASGRSITTIYRMASEHQWRRVPDGRRVKYYSDDVGNTFGWAA